jgi:hypothetical protein
VAEPAVIDKPVVPISEPVAIEPVKPVETIPEITTK